ncbi:hypothetical protein OB13_14260 [Pontibacter sp. HJ8]
MKNLFTPATTAELTRRIDALRPDTKQLWGKMNAAQMLAHCNVIYEMAFEDKHPKPNAFKRFILKMLLKNSVVNETPYKRNGMTAPQLKISNDKDFGAEKDRLIQYIRQTEAFGAAHFEGLESHSFGPLTSQEWNNMFYKHLDHHLSQFGV